MTQKILDIGCGINKYPNAIGIDSNPRSNADILFDINSGTLPFHNNIFDIVICHDVLEHIDNVIGTLSEIHRVCKPDAVVKIKVPFASGKTLWADVTHQRAFTSESFDHFITGTDVYKKYRYTDFTFEKISSYYDNGNFENAPLFRVINKGIISICNRMMPIYERFFLYWYPILNIHFELKVKKPIV